MKKGDILIVLFVAILSIGLLIFYKVSTTQHYPHKYAAIMVDGKIYKEVSLDDVNYREEIPIVTKYGKDVLLVKDGGVKVIYAECPDKICIKEGFIDKPGQSIICLPFRIVVEIRGVKNDKVDQVVY
ncbi:MAG TPA: NusG domain II-containing protein [Thermoanaerobacter sp.]|nr:NusG domain II-containing protein [Thermoanaerobacter sp.]